MARSGVSGIGSAFGGGDRFAAWAARPGGGRGRPCSEHTRLPDSRHLARTRRRLGATREEAGYEATLTARGVAWLLDEAMTLVPGLAEAPLLELWTGFRPLSLDGRPATGHGPTGIGPAPDRFAGLGRPITAETESAGRPSARVTRDRERPSALPGAA